MNYVLIVLILAICAGAYYDHTQEEQKITALQTEVDEAHKAAAATAAAAQNNAAPGESIPSPAESQSATAGVPAHHAVVLDNAEATHAGAVDSAAAAAEAAANGTDLGTVTTLDGHTYTNCKVVKIEQDGVTFSDDAGITKIEYAFMRPDLQKKFGYTPQGAVVRTEAEIRADEQQQAALTNAAPASP